MSNSPLLRSSSFAGHARGTLQTRVIAPCFVRPQGTPVLKLNCLPHLPRRGVRNDRAFYRARGATWVNHVASCAFRHTTRAPKHTVVLPCTRQRPRTQRIRPAFRTRMDFAACSMSQEASLPPSLPVRASCRPDMHLGRPPVLPASVPLSASGIGNPENSVRVRHRGGHRIPLSTPRRRPRRAP